MQPQIALHGYGGDFLIQPSAAVMDQYYHHQQQQQQQQQQQDISPGSTGIPSPTDSCSVYPMGMPMQQPNGYPPMQAVGMSPMFPPPHLQFGPGHPLRQRDFLRCRRKGDLVRLGYKSHPTAVARRNERERNRVKHINGTFSTLRKHLPSGAKNKKMSKVETLRSAIRYINHLQQILDAQDEEDSKSESEPLQSPHSTNDIPSSDMQSSFSRVAPRDSDEDLNHSGCSVYTGAADSSCSPDSRSLTHGPCDDVHQKDCAVPVSPACSSRSGDSDCSSSQHPAAPDTLSAPAPPPHDLTELAHWLQE